MMTPSADLPMTLWRGARLLGVIHLRASSTTEKLEGVTNPVPEIATFPPAALVGGTVWLLWAAVDASAAGAQREIAVRDGL